MFVALLVAPVHSFFISLMEVDTENVGVDESDALMRSDDDGVVNSNDNDNDEAPTVEETYEITTTRRKTIRTSYKIQEVSLT